MLSCRRGLPTWEARRLIRNTPRPGGEPWRTAVGAVSLDRLFFFFFSFFVVVAVWVLAAGTLDPCWCAAWNRPTPVAKCHHLAGLERDAMRPLRVSTAPLHHRALPACQPKAVARSRPPKWHPPPPRPGFAGHGIQTCSSCSLSPTTTHCVPHSTRDGTRQVRPKDGTGPSLPRRPGPVHERLHLPVEPASRPVLDRSRNPSLSLLLSRLALSSPGRIPNIEKESWCGL